MTTDQSAAGVVEFAVIRRARPVLKRSEHGARRAEAFRLLRGPWSIEATDRSGTDYGGWAVLRLGLQLGTIGARAERRAVYGDPTSSASRNVVLRAVALDVTRLVETGTVLPARFVVMPAATMRTWLDRLGAIQVAAADQADGIGEEVRSIRLEEDYLANLFEKAWRPGTPPSALDAAWQQVWDEMSSALEAGERLTNIIESFDPAGVSPAPNYDLDGYRVRGLR